MANLLRWFSRLATVLLRTLTLTGIVVFLTGVGILSMMPIKLMTGMPEQIANLLGPLAWCFGAMMAGIVFCHSAGTTFSNLLSRYVFGELVPVPSDNPGNSQT